MAAVKAMTDCPSEETLAAFLDGRLDPEARNLVIEHLAGCGECREVVYAGDEMGRLGVAEGREGEEANASREVVRGWFSSRTVKGVAALAAAIAVCFLIPGIRERLVDPSPGMTAIVHAAESLDHRPTDARLSADFPYRPVAQRFRGANDATGDPTAWPTAAILSDLETRRRAGKLPPRDLHVLGVSYLLLGNPKEAVEILEENVKRANDEEEVTRAIAASDDVALLTDLASAYHARADATGNSTDRVLASETAQRAWKMKHTATTAWNRAVTLEALGLREDALAAWDEYLRFDSTTPWAKEVQAHKEKIRTRTQLDDWNTVEPTIESLSDVALGALAVRFPQQAREYAEEQFLARFAEATARGDRNAAAVSLKRASLVGEALKAQTGESLLLESVEAIRGATAKERQDLIAGHLAYAEGRTASTEQRMGVARDRLAIAADRLSRGGSPFALKGVTYGAMATFQAGEPRRAEVEIMGRVEDMVTRGYSSCAAEMLWVLALIRFARGDTAIAIDDYRRARNLFARVREFEHAGSISARLAEALSHVGKDADAWTNRLEAFATVGVSGRRSYAILVDAAQAAGEEGYPLTSVVYQQRLVTIMRHDGEAVFLSDALQGFALACLAAGDHERATRAAEEALQVAKKVVDPTMLNRVTTNALIAEAKVARVTRPEYAIRIIPPALIFLREKGIRLRETELQVELSRAYAATGDRRSAVRALRSAIAEVEIQRAALRGPEQRRAFLDKSRVVGSALVSLLMDEDATQAFETSEALRGRSFLDIVDRNGLVASKVDAGKLASMLPGDSTVVEYAILQDSVVAWSLTRRGLQTYRLSVSPRQLRAGAMALRDACRHGHDEDCRESARAMYRRVILPLEARLGVDVVFVPDGPLFSIPFGALISPVTNRFLFEGHTVTISSSVAVFLANSRHRRDMHRTLLAVGNPSLRPESGRKWENLPDAESEARTVASLYETSILLTGRQATKRAILTALDRASIVHFAGHAVADTSSPEQSALLLAPEGRDDGRLLAAEIASRSLPGLNLVILSACETQVGPPSSDGPLSMAGAFLQAGVPAVVGTLWDTEDTSSRRFFLIFHRQLRESGDAAAALRAAQLSLAKESRSPNAWGAFVLYM